MRSRLPMLFFALVALASLVRCGPGGIPKMAPPEYEQAPAPPSSSASDDGGARD